MSGLGSISKIGGTPETKSLGKKTCGPHSGNLHRVRIRKAYRVLPNPLRYHRSRGASMKSRITSYHVGGRWPWSAAGPQTAASRDRSYRRRVAPSTAASGGRDGGARPPAALCALVRSPDAPDARGE